MIDIRTRTQCMIMVQQMCVILIYPEVSVICTAEDYGQFIVPICLSNPNLKCGFIHFIYSSITMSRFKLSCLL